MAAGKTRSDRRLTLLADHLAVALCYIAAIDDAVDPFSQTLEDEGWDIATLCAKAKKEIGVSMIDSETSLVIQAARHQRELNVREEPVYDECLGLVRQLVRRVE